MFNTLPTTPHHISPATMFSLHNILLHPQTRKQLHYPITLPLRPPSHTRTPHTALSTLARPLRRNMSTIHWRKRAYPARYPWQSHGHGRNVRTTFLTAKSSASSHCYRYRITSGSSLTTLSSDEALDLTLEHLYAGNRTASIQTTCHAGTHRSVAAAEILAAKLRRRGVRDVRVLHAHRKRRSWDLW